MPVGLLALWIVAILIVIAAVGGRALVVEYPGLTSALLRFAGLARPVAVKRSAMPVARRRLVSRLDERYVADLWITKMRRFQSQNRQNRSASEPQNREIMSNTAEARIDGLTASQRKMLDALARGELAITWVKDGRAANQEEVAKVFGAAKKTVGDELKASRARIADEVREREDAAIAARMAAAATAPKEYDSHPKGILTPLPDTVLRRKELQPTGS